MEESNERWGNKRGKWNFTGNVYLPLKLFPSSFLSSVRSKLLPFPLASSNRFLDQSWECDDQKKTVSSLVDPPPLTALPVLVIMEWKHFKMSRPIGK